MLDELNEYLMSMKYCETLLKTSFIDTLDKYYEAHGRNKDQKFEEEKKEEMKEEQSEEEEKNEGTPLAALIDKEVENEIEDFKS